MSHLFIAVLMFSPTVSADVVPAGEVASGGFLRPFSGRSGATKEKLLVVGCAKPESEAALLGGFVPELTARVQDAKDKAHADLLRKLADGGSRDWMTREQKTKKEIEELMKQLPPKYHAMIKEYFEKLEKLPQERK